MHFTTLFLKEANEFLDTLDPRAVRKIFFNIDVAEKTNDPRLLKKIHKYIWEFRTNYNGSQIRLLAFWDKSNSKNTLVVASNGFIKKSAKTPALELDRALRIRSKYLEDRN